MLISKFKTKILTDYLNKIYYKTLQADINPQFVNGGYLDPNIRNLIQNHLKSKQLIE
jgi:hypothetical protein